MLSQNLRQIMAALSNKEGTDHTAEVIQGMFDNDHITEEMATECMELLSIWMDYETVYILC